MGKWNWNPEYRKAMETARHYYLTGSDKNAELYLKKAIAISPEWWEAHTGMARVLILRYYDYWMMPGGTPHLFTSALDWARHGVALNPEADDAWATLGDSELFTANFERAISSYRKHLSFGKYHAGCISDLAFSMASLPSFTEDKSLQREVFRLISKALGISGGKHLSCIRVVGGCIYERIGKIDMAENLYHEAVGINPNCSEAINNLGEIALSRNNPVRAESLFRNALAINPAHPRYRWNLSRLPYAPLVQKG